MIFSSLRGRARHVSAAVRRRTARFVPSMIESLEARQLLAAGSFGINVEITPYTSFVNLLQTPGNWIDAPNQSNTITLNASGDPQSDASLLFDMRVNQSWNGPDPNAVAPNLSGTYNLSFNGEANVTSEYPGFSTPFTVQNQVYNASTNTTTVQLVVPANNYQDFFSIAFTNTQATATSGVGTGFSNAKLIRPGYAANSTQLYTNEFLSALQPYSVLRYLDPEDTNSQPFFNGSTLVTFGASQVDQTGLPWEYQIALANTTQTDMWINVPEGATNAYITALAGIFKSGGTVNGVSYPGLNSNLKVYLEYSDEVWGGIPYNEYYQEAAVENGASNQPLSTFTGNLDIYNNVDGSTSTDYNLAVGRRYLEETYDIGQIFQGVLGSDPTHQRIRPVLGWQENDPSFYPGALDWFQHFFGSASTAFYGMGDANYLNPTTYSSEGSIISTLESQETAFSIPDTTDFTTLATYYGLANVSYEGGPAISGDGTSSGDLNALAASRDPAMEQIILQEYEDFYASGGTLAMFYDGPFSGWSPTNEWGAAELSQYGNPTASPKYRGTVDVAAATPAVVTAGLTVSPTGQTNFSATTDTLGDNFSSPSAGQQGYWLLNVASGGTYDLNLATTVGGGASPGQVEVFLDDKQVGGTISMGTANSVDLGNLALSAGLNTLSIEVVSPGGQLKPATFTLTAPLVAGIPSVGDSGFETVVVGNGKFAYDPTGSAWAFSGYAGVSANASGFTYNNPAAPQGTQVAFLQETGSITQTLSGWAAGTYALSFDAAQRGYIINQHEDFEVLIDGVVVSAFTPTGTSYQPYSTGAFTVTAGSHVVEFLGLDSIGGDNTAFIDAVSVATAAGGSQLSAPTAGDSGFESVAVGNGNFAYDPTGSAWAFSGYAGVSGNASGFTSRNPNAPQGSQVGFVQETGSITQTVSGFAAGSYTISFDAAQRGNMINQQEDFEVLVDGKIVGTYKPSGSSYLAYTTGTFAVTAGAHLVQFLGLDTVGGDNTAFIDAFSIASAAGGPPPPTGPSAGDSSFESVVVGAGNYAYDPTGSAWAFSGYAGVSGNASGFTSQNPGAPQGSQVGFLQDTGSITQTVSGFAAGSYTIAFDAAQRGNMPNQQEDFEVLIDGVVVGSITPTSTSYQLYSTGLFTVTAGSHVVQFLGLDNGGGDNTAFIDAISVAVATAPTALPTLGDSGFETVPIGNGNFQYSPTGSAWTFNSTAYVGGTGVSGNNSPMTSGNPAAPQGSQVAFIEGIASFTQSVSGWAAGSYALSFDAAQRGNYGTQNEDFEVLIDGIVVGTFQPNSKSYQSFTTSTFTVSAGSHTIAFLGVDTARQDYTALIDAVTIV